MNDEAAPPTLDDSLRVLVVEDELLIAMGIEMILVEHGHTVLGPVDTVDAALGVLEDARPDAAVLDGNLRGRTVIPVAERLRSLHVPFVLASAYTSRDFDGSEALAGVENVGKPIYEVRLLEALGRAVAAT
jgi:two-component system, response regulator PdtaR